MDTKEKISKEHKYIAPILVIGTFFLVIGIGYVLWNLVERTYAINVIRTGCFETTFSNSNSEISLINAYPISDNEGLSTNAYTFTIDNTCSLNASYIVNLDTLDNTDLPLDSIKISVNSETPISLTSLDSANKTITNSIDSRKLIKGSLTTGENATYSIKLWIDEEANITNSDSLVYYGKITINTDNSN